MMSLIETSRSSAYFAMVNAGTQVSKKEWGKVIKGMPKPINRPGQEPDTNKTLSVKPREAKAAVQRIISNSMARAVSRR